MLLNYSDSCERLPVNTGMKNSQRAVAVPTEHMVKINESEKRDKFLDLPRELKMLWNKRMTAVPSVTDMLWMILKYLEEVDKPKQSKLQYFLDRP